MLSTKAYESELSLRKRFINFEEMIRVVFAWQEARPPLLETDMVLDTLITLLIGEVDEVLEEKGVEGLELHSIKSEHGESMDMAFFLVTVYRLLLINKDELDFNEILRLANGQAKNSHIIDTMREVAGNLSERSLKGDTKYLFVLWSSYVLHMVKGIDTSKVLYEYTLPKNSGNYPEGLLVQNHLFSQEFKKKMDKDELVAYFKHFRKALRLIRKTWVLIDPSLEDTGLLEEHWGPYQIHVFNFYPSQITGRDSAGALEELEKELDKLLLKRKRRN